VDPADIRLILMVKDFLGRFFPAPPVMPGVNILPVEIAKPQAVTLITIQVVIF
jgi:hypothetical protein